MSRFEIFNESSGNHMALFSSSFTAEEIAKKAPATEHIVPEEALAEALQGDLSAEIKPHLQKLGHEIISAA